MADDPPGPSAIYDSFVAGKREGYVRWAYVKLGSMEDAREVVNEVFFKIFLRWDDALASASADAFGFKILKDAIVDVLRKRDRSPCALVGLEFEPSVKPLLGIPDEEIERISTRMEIHQAIADLPARQQVCVTLHYLLGVSTEEIAGFTGMQPSTVRSHLAAARSSLASAFAVNPPTPAEKGP
ncbi:RNA polymerase sigma factor [Streptomyces sp. SBT349]|uniref:RNA polymerase sigma factor n=1 Tax=Streptomyces sp. SBT349 TaxID=1580539 RepID=UPI00131B616A|nr:RNA polymerase sigma factor [Streptomyces sp. SBT349]